VRDGQLKEFGSKFEGQKTTRRHANAILFKCFFFGETANAIPWNASRLGNGVFDENLFLFLMGKD
jgi:hypothetical protein